MKRLGRLTQLIGLNAVPVAGVAWAGWTNKTALALYWCETVMFIILVFIRIHVHRMATQKRGHYVEILVTSTSGNARRRRNKVGYFATSFLVFSLAFSLGQLFFLGFATRDTGDAVDRAKLIQGVEASAAFLFVGFVMDLAGIKERPFAWIRNMSMGALWRVFLVQFAIIIGAVGSTMFGWPRATLIAFVFLKLYTDATSQLPQYDPKEAPQWTQRIFGKGFAEFWRADKQKETEREAAEEQKFTGTPMPYEASLIQRSEG
jgi:uncharacterized protein DUF6498